MSQTLTIELPDESARRAPSVAAAGTRRLEDAVIDWIRQAVEDPEIEALSDHELLSVRCDSSLAADLQEELSGLLADSREDKGQPPVCEAIEPENERWPGPFIGDEMVLAPGDLPRTGPEFVRLYMHKETRPANLTPGE